MGKEWEDIYPAPSTKDDTTASLDEKLITLYSQLHTAARNGNFEAHVAKVPTLTKYCKNQKGVNDLKMRLLSFENTDISYATFRKEFISILKVLKSQEVPTN